MTVDQVTNHEVQVNDLAQASFPFDLGTPASVFLKVESEEGAFMLESVEGGQTLARFSFIGWDPLFRLTADDEGWLLYRQGESVRVPGEGLPALRPYLQRCRYEATPGLPPFASGLVGYMGYDMVRAAERLPQPPPDDLGLAGAHLVAPGVLYALDHATNSVTVLARGDERLSAQDRLEKGVARLRASAGARPPYFAGGGDELPLSNMTADHYRSMVRRAQEHIRAGDIFQAVLSQRLCRPMTSSPFDLYRALRRLNPSPYMFFLRCSGDLNLIGSSPEMFVRLRGDVAEQRPLAGTRRRGRTAEEDAALGDDLRADAKELAEHVMLVDLARNDLGRVCRYGTVEVPHLLEIERFSHVQHLVSHVRGRLRPELDAIDLLAASLPAGTVSGAPKVRAMEIIDDLEPTRRGPYAGAVGYLDARGNADTCITIRTIVVHDGRAYVQAGAGIVADSDPASEYQETMNKAAALLSALDIAANGAAGGLN